MMKFALPIYNRTRSLMYRMLDIYDQLNPKCVSLVYLANEKRFKHGFECEGTDSAPLTGIRSFPTVCCYPQEVCFF